MATGKIQNPRLNNVTGSLRDNLANGTGTTSQCSVTSSNGIGNVNYRRYNMSGQLINGNICIIDSDSLIPSTPIQILAFGKREGDSYADYFPIPGEIKTNGAVAIYYSSSINIDDIYIIATYPIK